MEELEFHLSWRSLAAVVYLLICLTDFIIMPAYREWNYTKLPVSQMVALSATLAEPSAQIEALKVIKEDRTWVPITNDMFHLSFGAILGVSALPTNRKGSGFRRNKKLPILDRYRRSARRREEDFYDEDDYSNDDYYSDDPRGEDDDMPVRD